MLGELQLQLGLREEALGFLATSRDARARAIGARLSLIRMLVSFGGVMPRKAKPRLR